MAFYEKLRFADIKAIGGRGFFVFCWWISSITGFTTSSCRNHLGSTRSTSSKREYNLSVGLRQGAIQTLFSAPFYIPLAFIGFIPSSFCVSSVQYTINSGYTQEVLRRWAYWNGL
jgi:hypothetical protein